MMKNGEVASGEERVAGNGNVIPDCDPTIVEDLSSSSKKSKESNWRRNSVYVTRAMRA